MVVAEIGGSVKGFRSQAAVEDWRGLFPGMACYGALCSQQGGRPKCQIQPGVHLPEGAGYGDVGVDARALVPVVTTRKSLAVVKRLARRHRLV
jgi:hypothetical protein